SPPRRAPANAFVPSVIPPATRDPPRFLAPRTVYSRRGMIIDRTHRGWIAAALALLTGAAAAYSWSAAGSPDPPSGGSRAGLAFGAASSALIVFCALYAARRRFPAARVGRAETWLKAHIWLGLLSFALALF